MKKIVSLLTFTLLLAGCAREVVPGTGEAFRTESLRASIVETRVEVDDLGKFSWTAGDQIAVHRSASGYETATLTEDGLFNVHLEEGEDRDAFAIYPARLADEAHSGASDLAVILPSEYTIPVDGMGIYSPVPMVAKNDPESEDLRFHHLGGLLRVSLDRVPYETQKICVNFGKRVTGSFTVANPSSAAPSISLDEGAAEDIVFTLENPVSGTANGFNLNIPLPKGSYTDAHIKVYDRYDNLLFEKSESIGFTIGRAQGLHGDLDLTVDVTTIPLCMKMARNGNIIVRNPRGLTIEYSRDKENWESFSSDCSIPAARGEMVFFRGNNASYGHIPDESAPYLSREKCTRFLSDAKCYILGNIMSLITPDPADFSVLTELTEPYTFSYMFSDEEYFNPISPLINSHPSLDLVLPATTLADNCYCGMFAETGIERMVLPATQMKPHCYERMFDACPKLTEVPALPAMDLAESCYEGMFEGSYITEMPVLSAMTLAKSCYQYMFGGCRSLKSCGELPATDLAESCYQGMFSNSGITAIPALPATTLARNCYYSMFSGCKSLQSVGNLPATQMAEYCYAYMFSYCEQLTEAPVLSATVLAEYCYENMFASCTSLTTAPDLPVTDIVSCCYRWMFDGCSSLVNAPALPATVLNSECYRGMFRNCTALTEAPVLPATTLREHCYMEMFEGCTSLTTAPVLPAEELGWTSYYGMFRNCTSLNYVKAMFKGYDDPNTLQEWLSGVSSTGTYVMNAAATYDRAEAGVPAGWTVETATE